MPLPVIVHRLSQSSHHPNSNPTVPDSPHSVNDFASQHTYSQSTINTMLNSFSELTATNGCDPLPTKGNLLQSKFKNLNVWLTST